MYVATSSSVLLCYEDNIKRYCYCYNYTLVLGCINTKFGNTFLS